MFKPSKNLLKEKNRNQFLFPASGVVFGIILSQSVEKIIEYKINTTTGMIILGFTGLAILIFIYIFMLNTNAKNREKVITKINDELSTINRKLGLKVTFVHDPPQQSSGEVYRRVREIIEKAQESIKILSYARPEKLEEIEQKVKSATKAYEKERQLYYDTLLKKIEENKDKKFFYRRIIQFPEGIDAKITKGRIGRRFEHIEKILDLFKKYPEAGCLKKAPCYSEETFIIIDGRYIITSFNAIDPESE
ncbi:MAG: hypothetical protein GWN01_14395, partial [Nitrosopumilaceae archaeon]|nr:hypothetical protein [Nitrosopumilaceae archaeon]NIU86448.1 hypothetical protein [Nitrosopumilaceae archaeon]NIX62648.1 hypothetical protein [Nitrosopumilaceae archaeon]